MNVLWSVSKHRTYVFRSELVYVCRTLVSLLLRMNGSRISSRGTEFKRLLVCVSMHHYFRFH